MKQEVAPLAWPAGETFNQQATEAVTHVVLTYSSRAGRYLSGICELAGVLLYGLSNDDIRKPSMDHEADTFWCLSQLLAEAQETLLGDDALAFQARRVHELHQAFDPPVAELLAQHGLGAIPALRLGTLLLSRAGFTLQQVDLPRPKMF